METLETLSRFVRNYPQTRENRLSYAFLGGTAVRLHQEAMGVKAPLEKRQISDFDLLLFEKGRYPVHTCTVDNVFGGMSLKPEEATRYVSSLVDGENTYFFMDGIFLAASKTTVIDTLREKDYDDIKMLAEAERVDFKKLGALYSKADRITKRDNLAQETLMDLITDPSKKAVVLFQAFPRLVNFLGEFGDPSIPHAMLRKYAQESERSGHALSSDIFCIHNVIKELKAFGERERITIVTQLLKKAKTLDYTSFDRYVNDKLVPQLASSRYAQKREILFGR